MSNASNAVQSGDSPRPSIHEWSWSRMLRRHFIVLLFGCSLLIHIGCLVMLQFVETETESPATGNQGVLYMFASRFMYTNILVMCLAVFLDSYLFCRSQEKEMPADRLDADFDIPPTKRQAAKELRFISKFSSRRWVLPLRVAGLIGCFLLKIGSWLLLPCVLCSVVKIFVPAKVLPDLFIRCVRFGLAISSLMGLVGGVLIVLSWMYCKYLEAKKRASRLLSQTIG